MDYNEKVRAAERLHEKARDLRGRFLNHVAVIERDIAVILTEYFCRENKDKRALFFTEMAEKTSLQKKKELLFNIVKADYPRFWEENAEHLNELQLIQEFRNKLAHSIVDVSEEALSRPPEAGIGFLQWKGGRLVTDREFDEFVVKANMVLSVLGDVRQLLPFKEEPRE